MTEDIVKEVVLCSYTKITSQLVGTFLFYLQKISCLNSYLLMFLLTKTAYVLPAFIFLPALLVLKMIFIMPLSVSVTAILLALLILLVVISTCPILTGVFLIV